jgi:two-component system OmpR family response regulator
MDVVVVRWPSEDRHLERVRSAGHPRLLLLTDGHAPPVAEDPLEDWIRMPASEADVRARMEALRRRAARRAPGPPELDGDGVVRHAGAWTPLPPVEARLAAALIERFDAVVTRETLAKAGWPAGSPGRNALDVHMLRLRRRLAPLGLSIRTVRSRGYLLERSAAVQEPVREA